MRIYTNLLDYKEVLPAAKQILNTRAVEWRRLDHIFGNPREEFRQGMRLSQFLITEKISFFFVDINYNFEGRVDHNDLYGGNFTWEQELRIDLYTPKLSRKKGGIVTERNIPSYRGGMNYTPPKKEFLELLKRLPEVPLTSR